jgi:hypothetical protein
VANYHSDWDMDSQFLTEDLHRVTVLEDKRSSLF